MLTGALAMTYYARPRMTRDIDLVVALAADGAPVVAAALGTEYYLDVDALVEAIRTRRPCNAIHFPTVVKIDLIPRKLASTGVSNSSDASRWRTRGSRSGS
jgi:hypothetical protein